MKKVILLLLSLTGCLAVFSQENPALLWLRYTAISPDGNTILFTYQGDIYKVSAQGGEAIPLTLYGGTDFMPVWSPDGKTIAFASDRHGNHDIFLMSVNGGEAKRLTYHSSDDFPYAFTPDGKEVLFSSVRQDDYKSVYFPTRVLPEAYKVAVGGGKEQLVTSVPMEYMQPNASGSVWLYQDRKGYEDPHRKRHTSSVTRDVWMYQPAENKFQKLTDFQGEDRNPVWSKDEKSIYYLSEEGGSFNIWKMDANPPIARQQITRFEQHPVRHLSISSNGILCFNFDGEVYTLKEGEEPKKVSIRISSGERYGKTVNEIMTSDATEMAVSPDGKEIAFVVRGEIFTTSLESGITKRITHSPEQERNISFSPDGKSILYAAEKNKIWGIYRTLRVRENETHFFSSTLLKEEALVVNEKENFDPKYNHDGTEIAYLEDRTAVKVYNLTSKTSREILPAERNYSYSDGDQWFDWSPDGKYLLVDYLEPRTWISQVGLANASGKEKIINLTESGYGADMGSWMMAGKMMIYISARHGMKNHASWGRQGDIYGLFFSAEAYEKFNLSKDELALLKEKEKESKKTEEKAKTPIVTIDQKGLMERRERLTIHSSILAGAVVTPDGESLYYLSKFEKGFDVWVHNFYEKETKLYHKLNAKSVGSLSMDKEGKNLFLVADGKLLKITLGGKADQKNISFKADFSIDPAAERAYLFEHAWRQVVKKFYREDLHGVDWNFYKQEYAKFLPHINNNHDFAEMLSELLGELNASHTGCRYSPKHENPDQTASLGLFFDNTYKGQGLKVAEIIEMGPVYLGKSEIKVGTVIEKINGIEINGENTFEKLMNRTSGKNTLLSLYDVDSKKRWEEIIKPISPGELNNLLYHHWVKKREADVERLSNGRLGYVHVQGMNDESFRKIYEKALGKYTHKEALIVDTRFNGGGWLHDDLATFLSGDVYLTFNPPGRDLGDEPMFKWKHPSVVLMGEGNYSDAHMFPVAYKTLNIGKLIGMPVPGTATAVWWEQLMDPTLVFGIPQVGIKNKEGAYLENNQLEPDIKVANAPEKAINAEDEQLKAAVDELLKQLESRK